MRFIVFCYRLLGRRLCQLFILPVVLYFFLTDPKGRRASHRYLRRVYAVPGGPEALGGRPGWRHSFVHYWVFGLSILDRVGFWLGRGDDFTFVFHGDTHLAELAREGRGAILLGAHLGSFDALRILAHRYERIVNVVMFVHHARKINAIFQGLGGQASVRIIHLDPTSIKAVFAIKACIERGELVALLADRVGVAAENRVGYVEFLGVPTLLPLGPFSLASMLKCPAIFIVALRAGDGRYEGFAEPLAPPSGPPAQDDPHSLAASYARQLERYCLKAPYQWFNFYDYWSEEVRPGRDASATG